MNTLDADNSAVWAAVESAWPHLPWSAATFHHGAFHHVAVLGSAAVVRLTSGVGHDDRAHAEHRNLAALSDAGLPFSAPKPLALPISGQGWSGQISTFVPGSHLPDLSWEEARMGIDFILTGLRELDGPVGPLRPVRQWCGGQEWPAIVDRIIHRFNYPAKAAAKHVVATVLEEESAATASLVHGDFGLHNIMWSEGQVPGIVDLDNACVGDPALDLAPLISQFGSNRVADLASRETVARAKTYRASLSLQVAAAAELVEDWKLKEFALSNFLKRLDAGTLHDPDKE